MSCLRLLWAYASGRYRNIPWASLLSIIAALIVWIINAVKNDLDNFLQWERTHPTLRQDPDDPPGA